MLRLLSDFEDINHFVNYKSLDLIFNKNPVKTKKVLTVAYTSFTSPKTRSRIPGRPLHSLDLHKQINIISTDSKGLAT